MDAQTLLITIACSATAHLIIACVIGIYARYKARYLALMWTNAIFAFSLIFVAFYTEQIVQARPIFMHPLMLTTLSAITFLQSIYPLSVPMPGFLQWRRMLLYALPAFLLLVSNAILHFCFGPAKEVHSFTQMLANFDTWGVLLRVAATVVSLYYIINIFRLPRVMARSSNVPNYLIGYCTSLGLVLIYYIFVSAFYSVLLVIIYLVLLTLLNVYLAFRTLEEMAIRLPMPAITYGDAAEVGEANGKDVDTKEDDDFNEANLHRFQRIQHWMWGHKDVWTESTFGRDRLCSEVGYNRHLVLQSMRSQGFNNVHEYIVGYRVSELKRLIRAGEVTTPSEATVVGFGTIVTARSCFQKVEGISLDEFIRRHTQPVEE
ncbi:MAG: hypothetical protein HUK03_00420 [Bacteroidaceae bacterium]|nr:hypothetical protein [Bacteroidaceae bacterium]